MMGIHSNSSLYEKQETLSYTQGDRTIVVLNIVKNLKFAL